MCTAITLQSKQGENFFGRTMDFSYPIDAGLYVIPKHFVWESQATMKKYKNDYRFLAIGQEAEGVLGFFDGVNEHGFAAAVLYLEGYADYDLPLENREPIAALDFLHYLLGRCRTIEDVKRMAKTIRITGVPDPVTKRAAPLHWMATDRSGKSVVIEQTKKGLEVLDNPIGVMANSPDFRWHMTNLRNYMAISPTQQNNVYWEDVQLTPFGQGAGTSEMPGGYTSPARFVRTAFLKTHTWLPEKRAEFLMTCFHVMNSVYVPKGVIVTDRGTYDYTKYVAFINTATCAYYFKTYENDQIMKASLADYDTSGTKPVFLGRISRPIEI